MKKRTRKPKPWRIALVGGFLDGKVRECELLPVRVSDTTVCGMTAKIERHIYELVWHEPASRQAVAVHVRGGRGRRGRLDIRP